MSSKPDLGNDATGDDEDGFLPDFADTLEFSDVERVQADQVAGPVRADIG